MTVTERTVNSEKHLQFLKNMISLRCHSLVCLQHESFGREGLSALNLAKLSWLRPLHAIVRLIKLNKINSHCLRHISFTCLTHSAIIYILCRSECPRD